MNERAEQLANQLRLAQDALAKRQSKLTKYRAVCLELLVSAGVDTSANTESDEAIVSAVKTLAASIYAKQHEEDIRASEIYGWEWDS